MFPTWAHFTLLLLIVKSETAILLFLSQRIDSFHVRLEQVVLMLYPVFNQILELFHLYLHNNLVNVRITFTTSLRTANSGVYGRVHIASRDDLAVSSDWRV